MEKKKPLNNCIHILSPTTLILRKENVPKASGFWAFVIQSELIGGFRGSNSRA
jgi:hypothetical protein